MGSHPVPGGVVCGDTGISVVEQRAEPSTWQVLWSLTHPPGACSCSQGDRGNWYGDCDPHPHEENGTFPRFLEQAPSSSPLGPVHLPKRTDPHHHFDNAQETGVYGAMS